MKAAWIVVVVVLAIIVLAFVGWYVSGLNRVVRLHEQTNEEWAQVETMIQRRYDLIPNLVETVRGYAKHEETVFTEVARLRTEWTGASTREQKIENAKAMESALGRLMVVVEQYPQLRATENFQTLQAQLEGTENRIAVQRTRYNTSARVFNTFIQEVFGSFFAKRRGLDKPVPYFEAAPEAAKAPEVKF